PTCPGTGTARAGTPAAPGPRCGAPTPCGRESAAARSAAMTRTPPPFGTPATRLHAGRILLVLTLLVGAAVASWIAIFHKGSKGAPPAVESSTAPGWTAAQMHYERPELKSETPAPKPVDLTAAELAKLRAMLAQMQAEIDALKNRKLPTATT